MAACASARSPGGGVRQAHGAHVGVAVHEVARIDLHPAPAADHDHPPAHGERSRVGPEIDVGEQLDDEVHAAPGVSSTAADEVAGFVVVEDVVDALGGDEGAAARRCRRSR